MKLSALGLFVLLTLAVVVRSQESEAIDDRPQQQGDGWWSKFKQRVKTVLSKWRDDVRELWDEVLAKADDMRGWTRDMFESFKKKMKEWLETRTEVPDDERNEIETFISKLKLPTETPPPKEINP